MENNMLQHFKYLGYQPGISFHVGAHKFEELHHYQELGFNQVYWFDPIDDYLPESLPQGHMYFKVLISQAPSPLVLS